MKRPPRRTEVRASKPDARRADRGVSDVVAFVFTFSIIITSVGVVSAVGFSTLDEIQGDQQSLNAQRGFQTLSGNFEEIDRRHVPSRSSEITLNDGRIRLSNGSSASSLDVSVSGGGTTIFNQVVNVGNLEYTSQDDTRIILESGAVIREDGFAQQPIVIDRPNFICRSDGSSKYAVVSVVKFVDPEGNAATKGGDSTVQILAQEQSSKLLVSSKAAESVVVNFGGSEFSEAWETDFERTDDWNVVSADEARCNVGPDGHVIVRKLVVNIDLVG